MPHLVKDGDGAYPLVFDRTSILAYQSVVPTVLFVIEESAHKPARDEVTSAHQASAILQEAVGVGYEICCFLSASEKIDPD